jgi:DNA repair ATPase RecN
MTTLRKAAQQALEALERVMSHGQAVQEAKDVLRAALAEPERQPLTDEEIDRVTDQQWAQNNHKPIYAAHRAYARAIEKAHGIGEQQ